LEKSDVKELTLTFQNSVMNSMDKCGFVKFKKEKH